MRTAEQEEFCKASENAFGFVLSVVKLQGKLPFELSEGFHLAAANDRQIEVIQQFLAKHWDFSQKYPYDTVMALPTPEASNARVSVKVPRDERMYWIVSFPSRYYRRHPYFELNTALSLCECDLIVDPVFCGGPHMGGIKSFLHPLPNSLGHSNCPVPIESIPVANVEDYACVRDYCSLIPIVIAEHRPIRRALEEYALLRTLPVNSRFLSLGYFTILESLLTHAPKSTESGESLTHQISAKMALLAKRFSRSLPLHGFAKGLTERKLWQKLYAYRSKIAHGAELNFKSKDLEPLRDDATVRAFLKEAVKLVLIQAFKEPDLILDLQQC